ncbi:MAG TPA: hypothetical protein VIL46_03315, partial [Gemmataceae bacterium]
WDHKLAAELRVLQQIFAEVVDRNARVAPSGRLLDPAGRVLKDYRGGVPGVLEFEIDRSAEYFTLEVPGQLIHQALSDAVEAPASELLDDSSEPVAEARAPIPTREEAPGAAPGPQPARPEAFEEMGGPPQPEPGSFHPVDEATDVLPDFDLEPPSDDLQIDLRTDEPEERQER